MFSGNNSGQQQRRVTRTDSTLSNETWIGAPEFSSFSVVASQQIPNSLWSLEWVKHANSGRVASPRQSVP